jgi:epoxide hydrolase 4
MATPFPAESPSSYLRRALSMVGAIIPAAVVAASALIGLPSLWSSSSPSPCARPPVVAPLSERWVEANGCRFHVVECGAPDGPSSSFPSSSSSPLPSPTPSKRRTRPKKLLLFLHGFPETWYSWREALEAFGLGGDVHAVAIDLRGYGDTDCDPSWPLSAYSLPTLVEDVRAVIVALGYESAYVCAHDWGGVIAWSFAAAHPALVERLAVLAAPHPRLVRKYMGLAQARRSLYILLFQLPYLPELYLRANNWAFLDGSFLGHNMGVRRRGKDGSGTVERSFSRPLTAEDVGAFRWSISRPGRATAALNYYRNLFGINLGHPVAGGSSSARPLPMPVLQLWGEKDGALGVELTQGLGRYCSDVKVEVVRDCSHWVQQDAVAETIARLADFFGARAWTTARGPRGIA